MEGAAKKAGNEKVNARAADATPTLLDRAKARGKIYEAAKCRRWDEEDKDGYDSRRIRRRICAAKRDKEWTPKETYAYVQEKETKREHDETTQITEKLKAEGKLKDIRFYFK